LSHFFYKINPSTAPINRNIIAYEYWFDNDYANAVTQNVTSQQSLDLNTIIATGSINTGIHSFNIRFKDDSKLWSSVLSQFFYKIPEQANLVSNKITTYRYWLDDDFAQANTVTLTTPIQQLNLIDNLDLTQVSKGIHTIHFQFKDSLNMWSVVTSDSLEKLALPIADFTYASSGNCDSTTVNFTDNSIDGDTYLWNFGDGNTSNETDPTHVFYNTSIYNVSLTVTDTSSGLDSTISVPVDIYMSSSATITETECDSYTAPDGAVYTTSGTKTAIIPNSVSCDSIITINLTIKQSTASSITETACDSYTAPDGIVYTTSGIKTATIPNSVSCDSVITINLTINTVDTSVVQNSYVLTSNASGASYQWLDCNNGNNPISGATNQAFTATSNGSYAVEVTQNGCVDTSSCFEVLTVSVTEEILRNNISIYPNPSSGTFVISSNLDNTMPIQVIDLLGKEVLSPRNINKGINKIDATRLNKGVYILKIASNATVYVQRIVID
jgi:PKD repeat protein